MPHDDATFTMELPGYHLHLWTPDTGTITHTAFSGSFSGPLPFLLDPDYPAFGDKESAPATHKAQFISGNKGSRRHRSASAPSRRS